MMNKNNNDFSPVEFYECEVRPKLNLESVLSPLNPKRSGDHLVLDCPDCMKREAYAYLNSDFITCNRKNHCSYSKSFITYLQSTNGKSWWEVVTHLAAEVGVAVPEQEYTSAEAIRIEERNRRQDILNRFQRILVENLQHDAGTSARKYLEERGFPKEFISTNEFGFFGNPESIKKRLMNHGHSQTEIDASGIFHDARWTGRIVYPIRERKKICDFWARDITGAVPKNEKYLRMSKQYAPDNATLFGLDKAGQDIILVEGPLDQLMLSAYGIQHSVSLGGSSLWNDHQKKLSEHKVKKITLALDDDKGGNDGISQIIEKLRNADIEVYVVPTELLGGLDPDEYVVKRGADSFKNLLSKEIHGFEHIAQTMLDKHKGNSDWTTAKKYKLLEEAGSFYSSVTNPKRTLAFEAFWETITYNADISDATIDQYRNDAQKKRIAEEQTKLREEKKNKIRSLVDAGNFDAILAEISAYQEKSNTEDHKFALLLENDSEKKLIEELQDEIPSIETGYKIGEVPLAFPAGGLSIIAGATGHGKTTVLINVSLGVNRNNPNANIYFFTYEEIKSRISVKFLNTYFGRPLNNGNNKGAIYHYFYKNGSDRFKYISQNQDEFEKTKKEYFDQLIDTGHLKIRQTHISVEELVEAIRFIQKNDTNAALIVIDYVQKLSLGKKTASARHEELKEICKLLESCAIETGLPIVLGAQFNRDVKTEADLNQYSIAEGHDIVRSAELMIGIWNRTHNSVEKADELYIKVLKGRNIGFGHETVMSFDGNTGVIKNQDNNINIKPATISSKKNNKSYQSQTNHFDKLAEL